MKASDLAFVLKVSIGVWGAQETDRETSDEILNLKRADSKAGRFIKNLLGGKVPELEAIKKFAASTRKKMQSLTIPYGDNSQYLIPISQTVELVSLVKKAQDEFESLVNNFVDIYPNILEEARQKSADLFKDGQLPSAEYVRDKFRFSYRIEPIPESSGFNTTFDLGPMQDDLKQEFDKKMSEVLTHGENVLKERLLSKVKSLRTMLVEYSGKAGQLKKNSFENAVMEAEIVRGLNITNVPDITDWANRLISIASAGSNEYKINLLARSAAISNLGIILIEMGEDIPASNEIQEDDPIAALIG